MNRNILITGGAGFIGSNLALKLAQRGHNVTIFDSLSAQIHGAEPEVTSPLYNSIKGKFRFIKGDITSKASLTNAIDNQNIIVHLAAETGTGQSMYKISHYTEVNIGGTALLLDLLANARHLVDKVVVASSRSVYGEGKYLSEEIGIVYPAHRADGDMKNGDFEVKYKGCKAPLKVLPTDEESKIHPSSVYGITKQNQEQMIMTVCPTLNVSAVSLRFQNVYGPGQSLTNPYTGILSIFSTLIKNQKEINVFEDGRETRDFVYIDDVVNATIMAIENEQANNEIFNVGTGVATTVNKVVNELIKNYGITVPVNISGNYRLGDIRHNFADISKIYNTLGFKPQTEFSEGISKFVNWVNNQDVKNDSYDQSIKEMTVKGLFK